MPKLLYWYFLHFRMVDIKPVIDQICDYHLLVNNLKIEGIELPEGLFPGCLETCNLMQM